MADISQIPTDQLLQMLQAHTAAPTQPATQAGGADSEPAVPSMPMTGRFGAVKPTWAQQLQASAPGEILHGFMQGAQGIPQLMAHAAALTGNETAQGIAQRGDAGMAESERSQQLARKLSETDTMPAWANPGSGIGQGLAQAPTALLMPGGALGGAILGATSPVADSSGPAGYWGPKALQTGASAAMGGLLRLANRTPQPPRNNTTIGATIGRAIPAEPMAQPDVQLVQDMRGLGVDIRPGQAATSRSVKAMEDQASGLPGSGYQQGGMQVSPNAQRDQWTTAVSRTFGENEPRLTQDVMARASARLGNNFETVFSRNQITNTPQLFQELQGLRTQAQDQLGEEAAPVLRAIDRAQSRLLDQGALPGRVYQTMRQRGGALDHVANAENPTIAYYGSRVRDALDNAFQAQAQGSDGALLAQTRQQWRNMMTVAPSAAKAPTGEISPALLLGSVAQEWGPENFARYGAGDLGTLARGGQRFLKEPPNSGTADRSFVMKLLSNPISTTAKAAAGLTASRGLNNAINSPAYANRLAPGLWPQPPPVQSGNAGQALTAAALTRLLLASPSTSNSNRQ